MQESLSCEATSDILMLHHLEYSFIRGRPWRCCVCYLEAWEEGVSGHFGTGALHVLEHSERCTSSGEGYCTRRHRVLLACRIEQKLSESGTLQVGLIDESRNPQTECSGRHLTARHSGVTEQHAGTRRIVVDVRYSRLGEIDVVIQFCEPNLASCPEGWETDDRRPH